MKDVVITWPKSKALNSYLYELQMAEILDKQINYRLAATPKEKMDRCYVVYDGMIRGYSKVIDCGTRTDVVDPTTGACMKPGMYLIRSPHWVSCIPTPMRGFQGFRYLEERPEEIKRSKFVWVHICPECLDIKLARTVGISVCDRSTLHPSRNGGILMDLVKYTLEKA